jgi:hypothetical protein
LFDDDRFGGGDFADWDHLNEVGAKKLSLMLNEETLMMAETPGQADPQTSLRIKVPPQATR